MRHECGRCPPTPRVNSARSWPPDPRALRLQQRRTPRRGASTDAELNLPGPTRSHLRCPDQSRYVSVMRRSATAETSLVTDLVTGHTSQEALSQWERACDDVGSGGRI